MVRLNEIIKLFLSKEPDMDMESVETRFFIKDDRVFHIYEEQYYEKLGITVLKGVMLDYNDKAVYEAYGYYKGYMDKQSASMPIAVKIYRYRKLLDGLPISIKIMKNRPETYTYLAICSCGEKISGSKQQILNHYMEKHMVYRPRNSWVMMECFLEAAIVFLQHQ